MSKESVMQALEAFIAEAEQSGIDIETIARNAKAGILSNKVYCWLNTTEKTKAIEAIDEAVSSVSNLPA